MPADGNRNMSTDPAVQFAAKLQAMQYQIDELKSAPFNIPFLASDPDDATGIRAWTVLVSGDYYLRVKYATTSTEPVTYITKEVKLAAPGITAPTAPPAAPSAPVTHTNIYDAVSTWSYGASGGRHEQIRLYYGNSQDGGDPFGTQRSLVLWPFAAMAVDLAGSTITNVSIELQSLHTWLGSGAQAYFGIHNFSTLPTTWAGGGIPKSKISSQHYGPTERKTFSTSTLFASMVRDGTGKGMVIEPLNGNVGYYGYFAGINTGYIPPKLHVTFVK